MFLLSSCSITVVMDPSYLCYSNKSHTGKKLKLKVLELVHTWPTQKDYTCISKDISVVNFKTCTYTLNETQQKITQCRLIAVDNKSDYDKSNMKNKGRTTRLH